MCISYPICIESTTRLAHLCVESFSSNTLMIGNSAYTSLDQFMRSPSLKKCNVDSALNLLLLLEMFILSCISCYFCCYIAEYSSFGSSNPSSPSHYFGVWEVQSLFCYVKTGPTCSCRPILEVVMRILRVLHTSW